MIFYFRVMLIEIHSFSDRKFSSVCVKILLFISSYLILLPFLLFLKQRKNHLKNLFLISDNNFIEIISMYRKHLSIEDKFHFKFSNSSYLQMKQIIGVHELMKVHKFHLLYNSNQQIAKIRKIMI